jgi:hypothetical protein
MPLVTHNGSLLPLFSHPRCLPRTSSLRRPMLLRGGSVDASLVPVAPPPRSSSLPTQWCSLRLPAQQRSPAALHPSPCPTELHSGPPSISLPDASPRTGSPMHAIPRAIFPMSGPRFATGRADGSGHGPNGGHNPLADHPSPLVEMQRRALQGAPTASSRAAFTTGGRAQATPRLLGEAQDGVPRRRSTMPSPFCVAPCGWRGLPLQQNLDPPVHCPLQCEEEERLRA